jgi:hypothetical protein
MFSIDTTHTRTVLALTFISLILSTQVAADMMTFEAGLDDSFGLGSDPLAAPSSELITIITTDYPGATTASFDGQPHNKQIAHTFVGLPEQILGGTLEFRVRGGSNPGVDSDGIIISFVDTNTDHWLDAIVWTRTLGEFGGGGVGSIFSDPDTGLVTPGNTWVPGAEGFVSLDLAALPLADGGTLNLIPFLNQYGFVDITVSDDSIVDFYRINLTVVPVPGAFLLGTIGLSLAGWKFRKRKEL